MEDNNDQDSYHIKFEFRKNARRKSNQRGSDSEFNDLQDFKPFENQTTRQRDSKCGQHQQYDHMRVSDEA